MKFQPERMDGINAIRAYAPDSITVNQQTWRGSVIVPHKGEPAAWDCPRFEDIAERHFEALVGLQPELVIVGSGRQHRFVSPVLARCLLTRRIGVESMDTAAACRTYNILAGEGRRVVALLLLD